MLRLTKEEQEISALLYPERNYWRPSTRGDCANVQRPCPFVACRHHIYLEVRRKGGLTMNFPNDEPWKMVQSCTLDLAEEGGMTLDQVGLILGVTRERTRQIEVRALAKVLEAATEDDRDLLRGIAECRQGDRWGIGEMLPK